MKENAYQQIRPYRRSNNLTDRVLYERMNERFGDGFINYWEQFGYEIGGIVCYSYVKWLSDYIDKQCPEITDIAFVARDGWLLKQIYEKLPHMRTIKTHYVYAPRSILLQCSNPEGRMEYKRYLDGLGFQGGTIAVVDTVTMKFTSQRLISENIDYQTKGFFWCVLKSANDDGRNFAYASFQTEQYHTIRNWNVMEFIMTSPESPVQSVQHGKPIYMEETQSEKTRKKAFDGIAKGVNAFVDDLLAFGPDLVFSNAFVTKWVNDFLKHPTKKDIAAFEEIRFSEREDHKDNILLDPFGVHSDMRAKHIKDVLWYYLQKHQRIYKILRVGKRMLRRVKDECAVMGTFRYKGNNSQEIMEQIENYDIVSFDVFDTLLLRPYAKPTDMFYDLEKENHLSNFHNERIAAEKNARQHSLGPEKEVNIFEIYKELGKIYSIDAQKFAQQELRMEKEKCFPNQDFLPILEELSKRHQHVIAVSDMYLPKHELEDLLHTCGVKGIKEIFVSCEYGVGKANGLLFEIVKEAYPGRSIVHIGDNLHSDVRGSKQCGITGILYQRKNKKKSVL